MKQMVPKYSKLFKTSGAIILMTGGGWACYQIYQTRYILSHMLKTEVLEVEKKRPEYIYINNPVFKEELELFKEDRHSQKYFFQRASVVHWWTSWKHNLAWRLLSMAQTGDLSDRKRAIQSLVELKDLKESDYRQLAQACDARTAVGLARTEGVDLRFFLKPPLSRSVSINQMELIENLRRLLQDLVNEKPHACVEYFLSKAFPEFQYRHKILDHDITSIESPDTVISNQQLIPLCLRNLLHHSSIGDNAKDIAAKGGLSLLMTIYWNCKDSTEIPVVLATIMANISVYHELLQDMYSTGWIGVLAQWAQDRNIRLSGPATKALANLDNDEHPNILFPRRVYLLHPTWRERNSPKMDVVFVHGLLGGVFTTWRQRDHGIQSWLTSPVNEIHSHETSDEETKEYLAGWKEDWEQVGLDFEFVMSDAPENCNTGATGPFSVSRHSPYAVHGTSVCKCDSTQCWPKDWLAEDCPYLRVLGVNYDTSLSMWGPVCPDDKTRCSLFQRSEELVQKLLMAGVGQRPVVWVAHSMGGLLVKNMLVKAWESKDPRLRQLCRNTKGVVFYSVPHRGSPLAALAPTVHFLLWPTIEVQELREKSPPLLELHSRFLGMTKQLPFKVISFSESKPTVVRALRMKFIFVPPESADPGVGEFFEIPQDHLCICKPASRQSFLYQKLLGFIKQFLIPPS